MLLFIFFFEASLIPLYFLIIEEGRSRRIRAGYYLFMYTCISGVFLLTACIVLYNEYNTVCINILNNRVPADWRFTNVVWLLTFFGLCIKVPSFPFHI